MGVRKAASKEASKKQSKPMLDVAVVMVCDFIALCTGHSASYSLHSHQLYSDVSKFFGAFYFSNKW
jgi:hypothetical protein